MNGDGRTLPRWLSIALQAGVSVGLIIILAVIVDWDAMRTALQSLSFSTVLVGFFEQGQHLGVVGRRNVARDECR